ncbi:hypothetical protein JXA32_14705 [Candidatus Sumerlaeota bacterium]|nr:hypothetical protein [Candidatus Sumerlaeota bacterium]
MLGLKQTSLLFGCALAGKRLSLVELRRGAEAIHGRKSLQATLSVDPLSDDTALIGRDIRNRMEEAGMRGGRCVLCAPMSLFYSCLIETPPISGEDLESFLALQAERNFPWPAQDLIWRSIFHESEERKRYALLIGLPLSKVNHLREAFAAAGLELVSIHTNISAFSGAQPASRIHLHLSPEGVEIGLLREDKPVALRMLAGCDPSSLDARTLAREMRVTLGQIPPALSDTIHEVQISHATDAQARDEERIQQSLEGIGLRMKRFAPAVRIDWDDPAAALAAPSAPMLIAARTLSGGSVAPNFLPPKINRFQQWQSSIASRRMLWIGGTAAMIVVIVALMFFWQQQRLTHLERELTSLSEDARQAETLQTKIRAYRSWFDRSARVLTIANQLTGAFPETGSVWARDLEIRENGQVICSGSARSNADWLKMRDALSQSPGVTNLQVNQVRGDSPLQFSFSYQWDGRPSHGI